MAAVDRGVPTIPRVAAVDRRMVVAQRGVAALCRTVRRIGSTALV
jgi:hypothetical protein